MKSRNGAIDFLKFVFSIIIVLVHANESLLAGTGHTIFPSGYIAVEFFFLVSGYMMAASYEKTISTSTLSYVRSKFLKCVPNFYVAWIISFTFFHVLDPNMAMNNILVDVIKALPELLFISMGGIYWSPIYIVVSWYLSAMLLSMLFLYPLLKKFGKTFFDVIAPVLFLASLGTLFNGYENLDTVFVWNTICFSGIIRAIMGLCGGCICYRLSKYLKQFSYTKLMRIIFSVIEWALYFWCIFNMFTLDGSKLDFATFLLLLPALNITLSQVSYDNVIFNNGIVYWLGRYSFSLYLGHTYLRVLHKYLYPLSWSTKERMLAYLISSIAMGLTIMYVSILLRKLWAKNQTKFIKMLIKK